jgi:hypothetical protein
MITAARTVLMTYCISLRVFNVWRTIASRFFSSPLNDLSKATALSSQPSARGAAQRYLRETMVEFYFVVVVVVGCCLLCWDRAFVVGSFGLLMGLGLNVRDTVLCFGSLVTGTTYRYACTRTRLVVSWIRVRSTRYQIPVDSVGDD